MLTILKYVSIILCAFYIYLKLLNKQGKLQRKNTLISMIYAVFLSISIYQMRATYPMLGIPMMVIPSIILNYYLIKLSMNITLSITIIAYAISYCSFSFSSLIISLVFYILKINDTPVTPFLLIAFAILVQFLIITIIFSIKRFKKGLPFLTKRSEINIGVFVSILVLLCIIIFDPSTQDKLFLIFPMLLIGICAVLITLWWRRNISNTYLDRIRAREIQQLEKDIFMKGEIIKQLEADNLELGKIIHRDNKIIPAMELSLRNYLEIVKAEIDQQTQIEGDAILQQLEMAAKDRVGIIKTYRVKTKRLPAVNIQSLDMLLFYLFNKGKQDDIEFDLTVADKFMNIIPDTITDADLNTVIADLVDNAIYAVKRSPQKNILVNLEHTGKYFNIEVFDSGNAFDPEVLVNLGIKNITSHKEDGGSGIGLYSTLEIARKCHSSLIIEEFDGDNSVFSKKVSLLFDNKKQYILKTSRIDKFQHILDRNDMVLIRKNKK